MRFLVDTVTNDIPGYINNRHTAVKTKKQKNLTDENCDIIINSMHYATGRRFEEIIMICKSQFVSTTLNTFLIIIIYDNIYSEPYFSVSTSIPREG